MNYNIMEEKYILAKITIPIKLSENDELEPLAEYMNMEIEECNEPLMEKENNIPIEQILQILQPKKEKKEEENKEEKQEKKKQQPIFVYPYELKKRLKGGFQQTFKNKKTKHNVTSANQKTKINLKEQDVDES